MTCGTTPRSAIRINTIRRISGTLQDQGFTNTMSSDGLVGRPCHAAALSRTCQKGRRWVTSSMRRSNTRSALDHPEKPRPECRFRKANPCLLSSSQDCRFSRIRIERADSGTSCAKPLWVGVSGTAQLRVLRSTSDFAMPPTTWAAKEIKRSPDGWLAHRDSKSESQY
jgi:hypothetical protein